jgi:hypothetical protein
MWADEDVYRIAKEIQLLKPDQFSNIFLGLGWFHMEKPSAMVRILSMV